MVLNGYEDVDRNILFSLKKDSRIRGHEITLVKDQCRLEISRGIRSHRGQLMNGTNDLQIV